MRRVLIGILFTFGYMLMILFLVNNIYLQGILIFCLGGTLSLLWSVGASSNYKQGYEDGRKTKQKRGGE